jgi:hypothetical protein
MQTEVLTLLQIDGDKLIWTGQIIDGADKVPIEGRVPNHELISNIRRDIKEQVEKLRKAYVKSKEPVVTTVTLPERGIFKDTLT